MLVSYVDRGNLGIATSAIMRDFRLTTGTMGWLLSAFFWGYGGFQLPAGAIVDRIGIKRVYAVAFLLWSLASAGIALSRGATDVLVLRLLLGLAESIGPIASLAFIRQNFSGPEQGTPTAIYIAAQNMGPALGTFLGTVLLDALGWRFMFAATGLGALLWLPCWLWLAPPDERRVARATADPAAERHWTWQDLLSARAFWAMSMSIFLSSYYWFFLLTWVPTYLTSSRGFTTLEMGRVLSGPLFTMAALNIVGGLIADRLVRRVGSVFRVRLSFAIAGYAAAGAVLLLLVLPGRAAVFPVLLISVCGMGIGNSNYWAISQHVPPSGMVGRTIGYLNTISQAAGAAAPLITGWILGPEKQFGLAVAIAGASPVMAAMCLALAGPAGLERMRSALAYVPTGDHARSAP
jgi:MFS family permease